MLAISSNIFNFVDELDSVQTLELVLEISFTPENLDFGKVLHESKYYTKVSQ